jgi:hypothetical protein
MKTLPALAVLVVPCVGAFGEPPAASTPEPGFQLAIPSGLSLSLQEGADGHARDAEPKPVEAPPVKQRFGDAGSTWLTFGGGVSFAAQEDDTDYNLFGAYSVFLADSLEFSVELGLWYFHQEGPDTGGVNGSMIFRWHFYMSDDRTFTAYGDVGIGLLGAFDEVPDGGTSFDFTPRAGGGITYQLDDEGDRLMLGVRWAHISNGRINSDENNPSRDSIMFYAGIVFPF